MEFIKIKLNNLKKQFKMPTTPIHRVSDEKFVKALLPELEMTVIDEEIMEFEDSSAETIAADLTTTYQTQFKVGRPDDRHGH